MSSAPELEDMSEQEVEAWYRCLSVAQYRDNRDPWHGVNYQLVSDLGNEEKIVEVNRSAQFLEKLFEFFMVKYAVYDLSQFKYFLRQKKQADQDCVDLDLEEVGNPPLRQYHRSTMSTNMEGKYDIDESARQKIFNREKQRLVMEARHVIAVVGASKILHPEVWKLVGLPCGFTLNEYREVLQEGICDLEPYDNERDQQEISEELDYVNESVKHDRATEDWSNELSALHMDLKTVSKLISYQTLASQDCIEYMTKRLCFYYEPSESMKRTLNYIELLATVLDEATVDELNSLRDRHFSELHNFVLRKREMMHLRRIFGMEAFCRWSKSSKSISCSSSSTKLDCDEYYIQDNLLAIYHGIRQDRILAKVEVRKPPYGKNGAIERVIEELCNSGTVSRRKTNKEWRKCLLLTCIEIGRDSEPPAYLHTNTDDFNTVYDYVISLAAAGL